MARFYFPHVSAYSSTSGDGVWTLEGGTVSDPQPVFSSDPLFAGHYTIVADLCHFHIEVDMNNIDGFGTGQFYMTLPFNADHDTMIQGGVLHDFSTGNSYAMIGEVAADSNVLYLYSTTSNAQLTPFSDSDNQPIRLAKEDDFYISGIYEIAHS